MDVGKINDNLHEPTTNQLRGYHLKKIFCILLLALSISLFDSVSARQLSPVASGGLSKKMRAETSHRWNMGCNVGLQGFPLNIQNNKLSQKA